MRTAIASLYRSTCRSVRGPWLFRPSIALCGVAVTLSISIAAFLLHFNLSAVSSLDLVLVVLVALRWGFLQATVISVVAVCCLNYFFVPPIFEFQVAEAEDWIALVIFEASALLVSGLSSKLRAHAAQVELARERTAKLYELSRAILLIDGHTPPSIELANLICTLIGVEHVDIWVVYEAGAAQLGGQQPVEPGSALEAFLAGADSEDPSLLTTRRILRLGRKPIGAIVLRKWVHDALLADAVASLAAVAIERARAVQEENRADAERNTERLRTAVLDGLAHSFKTPLTAIQSASSGLLAIDQYLSTTQRELISVIDEQAEVLGRLANRLLQTAALEAREIHLRRSRVSIPALVEDLLAGQEEILRARIHLSAAHPLDEIDVDAQLTQLALLQLIDNAAKYSMGGSMIDLAVTQDSRNTTIVVSNEGPAIRAEDRERIFERFYRGLDAPYGPSGNGLGLSIVRKAAEAHGGRTWVVCENGRTRFFFTLAHVQELQHG